MDDDTIDFEALRLPLASAGRVLVEAIDLYSETLDGVARVAQGAADDAEWIRERATKYGVALLTTARAIDVMLDAGNWSHAPVGLDPQPLVPIFRLLGESYTVMIGIYTVTHAQRAPITSLIELSAVLTPAALDWLATNVEYEIEVIEIPDHFTE